MKSSGKMLAEIFEEKRRPIALEHMAETLRQLQERSRGGKRQPDPTPAEAQAAVERLAAEFKSKPPSLGYGLRKQFGLLVGQKVESDPVHEDQAEAR